MIQVRRKEHETTGSLLRRFSRRVLQSRVLKDVRMAEYRRRNKSKAKKKKDALKREAGRKHYDRLRKLGKVKSHDSR